MGTNGSGKSSAFDVIHRMSRFINKEISLSETFFNSDLTKWMDKKVQTYELDIKTENGIYKYRLLVEFTDNRQKSRVKEEVLKLDDITLFSSKEGTANLYDDNGNLGANVLFDWTQSGVGAIQERDENRKLIYFKRFVENIVVVRPMPNLIQSVSQEEKSRLSLHMENFAAWYRYLVMENSSVIVDLSKELPESLPGFVTLNSVLSGEARVLKVEFRSSEKGKKQTYTFSSLSDGQKMIIAIYALIIGNKGKNASLFIDEPDNFISIDEIQPWLRLFIDDCGEGASLEQVVLISHHPEIIDYSALGIPIWFEREPESHTRIKHVGKGIVDSSKPLLTLSQTIARGLVE